MGDLSAGRFPALCLPGPVSALVLRGARADWLIVGAMLPSAHRATRHYFDAQLERVSFPLL
eukprot:14972773-Alexandrium_andersonii.AAC.1